MRDRQTCVGCGKKSPETETNYTLISAQFGWRLTRYKAPDGSLVVEWRCPTCWREYKRARTATPTGDAPASTRGSEMPPASQPPPRPAMPRPPTPMDAIVPRAPSTPGSMRSGRPVTPVPTPPTRRPAPAATPPTGPAPTPPTGRPGRTPR